MRPSLITWGLLVAAVATGIAVHGPPWTGGGRSPAIPQAAVHPVFPGLSAGDLEHATVSIQRGDGTVIVLQPAEDGHAVVVGGERWGPADREALEGLWASLTMATTLRAVSPGAPESPKRGRLVVQTPGGTMAVDIGSETADGVGVYGTLEHEGHARWVVEPELAVALDPQAQEWLSRRLLPLRASDITEVRFAQGSLVRGHDGRWRSMVGDQPALLSTPTVEGRLEAVLGANFEPVTTSARDESFRAWMTAIDQAGREHVVEAGDKCDDDGRLVSRGSGLAGCVDASALASWPLPGTDLGDEASARRWVEPRFLPHDYGRVLSIEQRLPTGMTLRRHGGGWVLHDTARAIDHAVDENEVYRWYDALHAATVVPVPETAQARFQADLEWWVHTDSTQVLRVACQVGPDSTTCRRDDGPILVLEGGFGPLGLDPRQFTPRRLSSFAVDDVRALEILAGSDKVRYSVHHDLGVWRLDAPHHPAGDDALDEVALEGMLGRLAALRADQWHDGPIVPDRTFRLDFRGGGQPTVEVVLDDQCRVAVGARRPAVIDAATCAQLGGMLLYRDPLRGALGRADSLELRAGDKVLVQARRRGEGWDAAAPNARDWLAWLDAWRAGELRTGVAPTDPVVEVRVLPAAGAWTRWKIGEGWARAYGEDWYYVQDDTEALSLPSVP